MAAWSNRTTLHACGCCRDAIYRVRSLLYQRSHRADAINRVPTSILNQHRLFPKARFREHTQWRQFSGIGHEHDEFLRSGLLDLLYAPADGIGRADQGLLANTTRWDVALEGRAFSPGLVVGFGDGAVEQDGAMDRVVVAAHAIAVLLDDGKFAL